ncbi:uncharacterized protein BYT42DRAFT_377824 [Radiomyces spectabilis]|uniref:uncharacterized protein n=1 Tax=Radiomyces spectabilis TaxID=64574 RepID=UPI00221FFC60|nr:uncharacterized protein BYT42DRAFT_377824 [Radiomyces spectabilis]KAI8376189.1 hypothetical protein BYT42DRAFT_377824 [Radiomyces spectabilis]
MTMSSCESISRRPIKSRLSSSPPHPVNTKCSKSLNHKTTQSQSDTTKHTPKSFPSHVKRCSLGSITGTKKPISSIHHAEKTIWRSPGHCEIPNILGNAYLQLKPVEQHRPKKSKPLQAGPTRGCRVKREDRQSRNAHETTVPLLFFSKKKILYWQP